MRLSLNGVANILLTASAVAVAAAAVRKNSTTSRARDSSPANSAPRYIADWQDIAAQGHLIGDAAAPVKVMEFADLECPYCRQFHEQYVRDFGRNSKDVALIYVHYPLRMHRFARPAARAAECAGAQGRFGQFEGAVYDRQDSLGLKTWSSYARDAGVADTIAFTRCASDTSRVDRIERGLAAGNHLAISGTPTLLINGWLYPMVPFDSLPQLVAQFRAGHAPTDKETR